MTTFTTNGTQLLRNSKHIADCATDDVARALAVVLENFVPGLFFVADDVHDFVVKVLLS